MPSLHGGAFDGGRLRIRAKFQVKFIRGKDLPGRSRVTATEWEGGV
jgi:hypothetical protein